MRGPVARGSRSNGWRLNLKIAGWKAQRPEIQYALDNHRATADTNHHHLFRFVEKFIAGRKHILRGLLLCTGIAVILNGCSARRPPHPVTLSVDRGYVDIKAGWRIRVVTPITRSGTFQVQTTQTELSGSNVTLNSGNDFLGYEVAYYAVTAHPSGGVAVSFVRAERIIGGATSQEASPQVRLFDLPENDRYIRLVFLTRVSQADHNEAIIATSNLADLEDLTEKIEANPEMNCQRELQGICSWVPAGISVQPERREPQRSHQWVPAT